MLLELSPGKTTIVDVGANVGQFAIPLAKQGHQLFSFEPVDDTCQKLKDNIRKAGVDSKIKVSCAGVDAAESVKNFGYIGKVDPGSASYQLIKDPNVPDAHVKSTVRIAPVHAFLTAEEIRNVHVFKTDTQGNEEAVLRGASRLLQGKHHPRFLLIEFSHHLLAAAGTDPRDILEIVYDAGYFCTHLTYHHPVSKNSEGRNNYRTVDTPDALCSGPVSATFAEFVASIGPHGSWKVGGRKLANEYLGKGGWTDLLCFA